MLIRAFCFSKAIFGSEGLVTTHIGFVRSDHFLIPGRTLFPPPPKVL